MFVACIISIVEWVLLAGRLTRALPAAGIRQIPRRLLLFIIIWLCSGALTLVHTIGFLLDELLFRRYRSISVRQPVFILGIPRSGTTWLHRVLAKDQRFATLSLWECLLAPSISERYCYRAMAQVFSPLIALLNRRAPDFIRRFDSIHTLRLHEPEEDFLLLAPLHACFLWVILCPQSSHYWQLAYFDQRLSRWRRRLVMTFYQRCLQKHLYFHGHNKRILSKNPSFTPLLNTLAAHFPDARFIACVRDPLEAVPSQLSSLEPSLQSLGLTMTDSRFQVAIEDMLHYYYQRIRRLRQARQLIVVEVNQLTQQLAPCVQSIYAELRWEFTPQFTSALNAMVKTGSNYQSGHRYNLQRFNLSASQLAQRFDDCWPIEPLTIRG